MIHKSIEDLISKSDKTESIIRMCHCGGDNWPPKPCLSVYKYKDFQFAYCEQCNTAWCVRSFNILEFINNLERHNGQL